MGSLGVDSSINKAMWLCPQVMGASPSERWGHSACYFNGFLYIFGGCRGGVHFSDVLVCNLETMTWNNLKTSGQGPGPRDSHAAVLVGHRMFVFGGTNGYRKVNELHILDLLSREWTRPECCGILPSPRESHTANAWNDEKLIVFGGSGEGEANYLNDLHVLDLKSMEWSSPRVKGDIPAPRDSHSSVAMGNRLFVFGGDSGDRYQGDVCMLDMNTFAWSKVVAHGPSPGPRAGHTTVSIGTKVYVFGGVGDKKYYNDIWILDVIASSWVQLDICTLKSQARFSHTATVTHLGITIFGGCGEDERPTNELFILQIDSLPCRMPQKEGIQMFRRRALNNLNTIVISESDNEDLLTKDIEELDFLPKESFHVGSGMLHPKRRRTDNSTLHESKTDPEELQLPHSRHTSPSISDHEPAPIKDTTCPSYRVHPMFRQRIPSPSNNRLNTHPVNQTTTNRTISWPFKDIPIPTEHLNGTDSCQVHCQPPESLPIDAARLKNLVGAEVRGRVDAAFDSGYLMTATVNGKVFRGVLFAPGPDLMPRDVGQQPLPLSHQSGPNHANARKNHFNVAYPRYAQQPVKLMAPFSRQTQPRLPQGIRTSLPLGRDSKLNSELQGVVLTLAPGSDL